MFQTPMRRARHAATARTTGHFCRFGCQHPGVYCDAISHYRPFRTRQHQCEPRWTHLEHPTFGFRDWFMGIGPSVSPASQTAGGCRAARRHRQCWFGSCRVLASCRLPVCNGLALGTIAWLAWAEVFGDDSRTGDIAVIGPIVGTIGSPAVGMFLDRFGTDTLFIALGVSTLCHCSSCIPVNLTSGERVRRERHRPTRSALLAMLALGCSPLAAVRSLCFRTASGEEMSVCRPYLFRSSTRVIQLRAFHHLVIRVNDFMRVAGFLRRQRAQSLSACSSSDLICTRSDIVGIFFWMAVPACFSVLAAHSKYPAEQAVARRPTWLGAESLDRSSEEPCSR